jgi:hypothetical protein
VYDDRSKDKLTESISQESDFRATVMNKNRNVQCTIAISRGDVLRKQDLDLVGGSQLIVHPPSTTCKHSNRGAHIQS